MQQTKQQRRSNVRMLFFNWINMAKKYENFSVGDNLSKTSDSYSAWTNDLLRKLVAGKTIIQPSESTGGHRLIESEVV